MTAEQETSLEARATFADRIDILYALGRHYLSLPFAALCLPTAFFINRGPTWFTIMPLLLLLAVTIVAEQLNQAYFKEPREGDAQYWARRYTFLSGIAGATWGVGALLWFIPGSFAAEAYLVLAFLGMTATEFIARSAYRPAYVVHACFSLGPLMAILLWHGGTYEVMTAILVAFFAGVLYTYCNGMGRLLDESIRLKRDNAGLVVKLSREKGDAEKARDAAEGSARAKSVFIANISHEIRTPLNALLGMAQLLERAELDKPYRDHVKVLLEASRGLQTLLDDVITLSRLDGEEDTEDEACDPAQAARAVARLMQPRAWEKRLRLNVNAPAQLPRVNCDSRRIRQVLLKLTENALKFTERGGVEIHIAMDTDDSSKQFLRFSVVDTGLGIPEEVMPHLFEPFTPGDPSYARRHQGAGLGLAVVKRIVDSLGGQVGFESEAGEGSTFWFSVPVERPAATGHIKTSLATPPPTDRTFLMHVNDPRVRVTLANLLEPFGNRIVNADDMADTVARAGRESFDAVIVAANDADTIAATPGNKTPVLAIIFKGERTPSGAESILRWPADPADVFGALRFLANGPREQTAGVIPQIDVPAAIDVPTFAALEKSVGLTTLIEILQSYIKTAEDLSNAFATACQLDNWDEAGRLAQDMAGAAGGLGLAAMTTAARGFAQKAREGNTPHDLRNAAQTIVGEHLRARAALINLYPDLAA
jgi:signal transduction histidine kinase/HPt (histidine-containing phosphotransfer) domain-containing protein